MSTKKFNDWNPRSQAKLIEDICKRAADDDPRADQEDDLPSIYWWIVYLSILGGFVALMYWRFG